MSLTLILGIIISFLTALWISWIYRILKRGDMDADKAGKLIDIGKWSIASVALVLASAIVSDSFKEREHDINELNYFDKYVTIFSKTEGMLEKWNLIEYLSAVAPEGDLKKSWTIYRDTLEPKYREYLKSKTVLAKLDTASKLTPKQEVEYKKAAETIQQLDKPLVSPSTATIVSKIEIFYLTDLEAEAKPRAERTKKLLEETYPGTTVEVSVLNPEINSKSGYRISANEIRYNIGEEEIASEISKVLNQSGIFNLEKPRLKLVRNFTPGYVSIFVRNM